MNKFSKLFLAFAASTMVLTGCSSEEPAGGVVTPTEGNLYTTLTIQLPTGSRSSTDDRTPGSNSNNGYEVGNDSENSVGAVYVVLTDKDYGFITASLADAHTAMNQPEGRPTYNIQFETRDLYKYAGTDVYVFAYCNPTADLRGQLAALKNQVEDAAEGTPLPSIADLTNVENASISTKNGFLMSNALLSEVKTLPTTKQMDELYNTPENPFNLGTIKVERTTARFDFQQTTIDAAYGVNVYPIYNHNNSDLDEEGNVVAKNGPVAFVELTGMALFNVANNYYYLPRVSDTGLNSGKGFALCGYETTTNYVVSPNAENKIAKNLDLTWMKDAYSFNGLNEAGLINPEDTDFNYEAMNKTLGEDNPNETWTGTTGDYFIWNYVNENTIPAYELDGTKSYQRVGCTTGIIFRGQLKASTAEGANTELSAAINAGENILYAFNGILYGDLEMLKKAVLAAPVSTLADQFMAQFKVTEITADALARVTEDLENTVADGFALYRPTDGKYLMYYIYKNRHNDNGLNTMMAPMEFSVVRNNVYKLKVSNILEFGHPGNPGDDPDPEDPDDPDETPKTYFRVQVQVLPWVVRVNNIIL